MLAAEIVSDVQLKENIEFELRKNYKGSELLGAQFFLNQLIELLATSLNDFDKKKNNKFVGYSELEQYHTIAVMIVKILPVLTLEFIKSGK